MARPLWMGHSRFAGLVKSIRFAKLNYLGQDGSINKKLSSLISSRERV